MKIDLPRGWKDLQHQAAFDLVGVEFDYLERMRDAVDEVTKDLVLPKDETEQAEVLQSVADKLAKAIARLVFKLRHDARIAANDALSRELEELGFDGPELSSTRTDAANAAAAGLSYSSAWLAAVLANDGQNIQTVTKAQDFRLRRIATTEAAQAYNDEHAKGLDEVQEEHREREYLPFLVRRWDALLDRKTCAVCRDHDGEYTPIGMDFSGGDEPGFVHANCRCVAALVPLAGFYDKAA